MTRTDKVIGTPIALPRINVEREVMSRKERWDHGNCSEMNTWTHLSQDVPCQLFNQLKDELHDFTEKDQRLLDASLRGHLAKTF
ncbi:13116_t:CDS:2, partial [Funneliformis mosseae]